MKIAVLSDIHDNIWNLEKVLKQIKGKVKAIIYCGDLCAPFTAELLASANLSTYICLGNNDEDHLSLYRKGSDKFSWVHLGQEFGEVKLGGKEIAFCHYPRLAELLAKSGDYDAVFYGLNKAGVKKICELKAAGCGLRAIIQIYIQFKHTRRNLSN